MQRGCSKGNLGVISGDRISKKKTTRKETMTTTKMKLRRKKRRKRTMLHWNWRKYKPPKQ